MAYDFDLFVIGAGSGGVRAARIAAAHGAKVGIAEEYRIGGTCVIRGCVPKKLMVYASRFTDAFEDAKAFGWDVKEKPAFHWPALREKLREEVERLSWLYAQNLERHGVEIFPSRAEFAGPHEICLVAEERTVTAEKILIATGAAPWVPHNVPGAAYAITSNEVFELDVLPQSMAIVGGGYIAVEFASIFNGLGVDVHLLYRGAPILRGFDMELREKLSAALRARGITIHEHAEVDRIEKRGEALLVHTRKGEALSVEQVMYATGREPYTFDLHLEKAGVAVAPNGAVKVDAYNRTSVAHIFAVGDVTDTPVQLTPVAIREGHAFADREFGGKDVPPLNYEGVPTAVFTTPEMATCGLTEEQARERHGEVEVYRTEFRPMMHTISGRQEKMFMKLLVHPESRKLLGAHLIGEAAGEMIQLLAALISAGATKEQLDATIAVHPTAAEELVTMRTPS
jgi:glutathione reductase (NADPH)